GLDMEAAEAAAAALVQQADEIDHRIGPRERAGDLVAVADIAGDGDDLADAAQGLQEAGAFGIAHGDDDAPAVLGQRAHEIAADEPGTAEHHDVATRHHLPPLAAAILEQVRRGSKRSDA